MMKKKPEEKKYELSIEDLKGLWKAEEMIEASVNGLDSCKRSKEMELHQLAFSVGEVYSDLHYALYLIKKAIDKHA